MSTVTPMMKLYGEKGMALSYTIKHSLIASALFYCNAIVILAQHFIVNYRAVMQVNYTASDILRAN